jgi:hypothetical protein
MSTHQYGYEQGYVPFDVHDIYVMKFLNCVCVFYVRIKTFIQ